MHTASTSSTTSIAAKTTPRAVVQLLHGVGEHAGRYGALVDALTSAGYTVYAGDLRGHGRTGMKQHQGDVAKLGHLGRGGLRATVAAIWQLTEIIHDENPGLPVVLLGHSWGSFIAQMVVNDHPEGYDGLILSGSAYRMPGWLRAGGHNKPWDGPDATGLEWLASDPAVGVAFREDPLTTRRRRSSCSGRSRWGRTTVARARTSATTFHSSSSSGATTPSADRAACTSSPTSIAPAPG